MTFDETPEDAILACGVVAELDVPMRRQVEQTAAGFRGQDAAFARWAAGYGVIAHDPLTQTRIHDLVRALVSQGLIADAATAYSRLEAADRLANAAMWLVVHMTYARPCFGSTPRRQSRNTPLMRFSRINRSSRVPRACARSCRNKLLARACDRTTRMASSGSTA